MTLQVEKIQFSRMEDERVGLPPPQLIKTKINAYRKETIIMKQMRMKPHIFFPEYVCRQVVGVEKDSGGYLFK